MISEILFFKFQLEIVINVKFRLVSSEISFMRKIFLDWSSSNPQQCFEHYIVYSYFTHINIRLGDNGPFLNGIGSHSRR